MDAVLLGVVGTLVGTVVGGFGSYLTTSMTTAKTLRVQTENSLRGLDAAHGQSLQGLQAPVYGQAIAAIIYRREKREYDLSSIRWDKDKEHLIRSALADYHPSNWYESQSQLALYASQAVLEANELANNAHEEILRLRRQQADLSEEAAAARDAEPTDRDELVDLGRQYRILFEKIQTALKEAAVADANVIELMRTGIHIRPSQYLPVSPGARSSST